MRTDNDVFTYVDHLLEKDREVQEAGNEDSDEDDESSKCLAKPIRQVSNAR